MMCFIHTGWQMLSRGDAPQDVIQRSAMSPPEQSSTDARLYLPVNHFHEYSVGLLPTHSAWSELISPGHLSLPKMLMVESFEVILQGYLIFGATGQVQVKWVCMEISVQMTVS